MDVFEQWKRVSPRPSVDLDLVIVPGEKNETAGIQATSGFLRHWPLLDRLIQYVENTPFTHAPEILFAADPFGCNAYTFAMGAMDVGLFKKHPDMKIYCQDINPDFLKLAAQGIYPRLYAHFTEWDTYKEFFEEFSHGRGDYIRIRDDIRNKVTVLPAHDLAYYKPGDMRFDIVACLHLFQHFTDMPSGEDRKRDLLVSLLKMGQLVCVNERTINAPTAYPDIPPRMLSAAFNAFPEGTKFSAMNDRMQPGNPIAPEDYTDAACLGAFYPHPRLSKEVLIYRCDA